MKYHNIFIVLTAAVLLICANLTCAFENNVSAEQEAASKAKANQNAIKSHLEARRKATAMGNPVDLNYATSQQLQKLPGVSDVVAKKIIAGRPYVSNRDLLTRNVINKEIYDNIKRRIYVMPRKNIGAKKSTANMQKE